MQAVSRPVELRMLLPLVVLVPLGFAVTNIARTDVLDPGPMGLAIGYVALVIGAHLALRLVGNRGDQLLLPAAAAIGAVGIVMLNRLPQSLFGTDVFGVELGMATTQLLWFAVGLTAMVAVATLYRDDGILRHYKYSWALAGALLLVITFLFGREVNGARLWIYIGPVGFQPGEAIKIVLVVFIAAYLAEKRALLSEASARIGPIRIPPLPYLLPMVAIFVIVMLIVVVSRDLGTALLFLGIFLTMLFVATGRRSYVLLGLLLFVVGSFVAYNLFGHVRVRVDNWIDPFADPSGTGYQTVQALYAFGRGGLFGEGLGQGLPSISGRLPIPALPTDFIFAAVAEELGLIGAFALLALAMVLVFRGLRTAMLARDDFSAMLAVGLTVSLGLQTLIIAAGNVKLVPLTGITFPFVSYGGSSLLASFVVVGLLLAISHRSAVDAAVEGRGP
ncbi:MAG TPA: FtsW/RodA/SpoVE family cell cycle protein [Candidatus Limnocylindria bacterium]|nr:FtsW/RodA/SpoVE family cell cycle protein [Candidatus Limnocylindria bacterium]